VPVDECLLPACICGIPVWGVETSTRAALRVSNCSTVTVTEVGYGPLLTGYRPHDSMVPAPQRARVIIYWTCCSITREIRTRWRFSQEWLIDRSPSWRGGRTQGTCPGHWILRYGIIWPILARCSTATRSCPPHWLNLTKVSGAFILKTICSQDYSFPRLFVPMMELSFSGSFVPWNIHSQEWILRGTFVPWTIRSWERRP